MDRVVEAHISAPPAAVGAALCDLGTYPRWLDLVSACDPANPLDTDSGPAWWVTLRARIGPLARSKRLRMVRVDHTPATSARFERREVDGRDHSPWTLDVGVEPDAEGAKMRVELAYGGPLWSSILDGALGSQIQAATPALATYLNQGDQASPNSDGR